MAQKPKSSSTRQTQTKSTRQSSPEKKSTGTHRPSEKKARATGKKPAEHEKKKREWKRPWSDLSTDRKLDIAGIVLGLTGLLLLLSLISFEKSLLTLGVLRFFSSITGWGAYLLPIGFIGLGSWMIFRKLEKVPTFSGIRVTGVVLLFLNILGWLHLLAGTTWEATPLGKGGGYIGGIIALGLVALLGKAGTVVFLLAWLIASLQLIFKVTLHEIVSFLAGWFARIYQRFFTISQPQQNAVQPPLPLTQTTQQPGSHVDAKPHLTLANLKPLKDRSEKIQPSSTQAGKSQITTVGQTTAKTAQPVQQTSTHPSSSAQTAPPPANPLETEVPVFSPDTHPPIVWNLPSIDDILDPPTDITIKATMDQDRGKVIEETLTAFGAPGHIVEVNRGPTITQYAVEPDFVEGRTGKTRVRVNKIVSLADDLALALAAPRIRIEAPVPGHNYVGIEVPNSESCPVTLRELLESRAFNQINSPLRFAIGKDVSGRVYANDLRAMPHLLIAGTTGSGKSVCVNSILCSLLLNNTPNTLRLVLVDPKRVELTGYNGIPHLLTSVIVDSDRVVGALQWVLREMDIRYRKFTKGKVRNILEFNEKYPQETLPYLVVVIDELADLMMTAPEETERSLTRLSQLARATGIHLILATQRPSVNVITGIIKANFPSRIAFAVASGMDSRVILDQVGAERLLGRGDMLFQAADASAPVRLQGAYVSDSEIQLLVDYWRSNAGQSSLVQASGQADSLPRGVPLKQIPLWDENKSDQDPLLDEAIDIARREGRASITMLQTKLRVGYTRAAKMIDAMEAKKIIGPRSDQSQVHPILDYGQAGPPPEEPD